MEIPMTITDILLDIEGTTTPIDFVFKVLFPYAKKQLPDFLARKGNDPEVKEDLVLLREEYAAEVPNPKLPDFSTDPIPYLNWLIEIDRKSPALKSLQGKIWEEGFYSGELKGEIFEDIKPSFERWKKLGRRISIYSSGSVLAQKMLFKFSTEGDLTQFLHAHFDTGVGGKREAESYARIARELSVPSANILFVSDIEEELDAAQKAGMNTALSIRPGNKPCSSEVKHQKFENFLNL